MSIVVHKHYHLGSAVVALGYDIFRQTKARLRADSAVQYRDWLYRNSH
jgi:hypothetical protein